MGELTSTDSRLVAGAGVVVFLPGVSAGERDERIDEAEQRIRGELDELDPVARAEVLADIAT